MSLARRYQRLGRNEDAAQCAAHALRVDAEWGHVLGEMAPGTRARAEALVAAA